MSDPDGLNDLDAIVSQLNAGAPKALKGDQQLRRLERWLEQVVERNASDLLLVAGAPPALRTDGVITPLLEGPLDSDEIADSITPALAPHARRAYRQTGIADSSYRIPDVGRFRINLHHERGHAAAAIRRLPATVPRFASLNLPPGVEALTRLQRGLVLIGGPTGAGKTTTLAALINEMNLRDARHIVTIEDPIEYEHPHRKSIIEQVEVGVDAADFPTALRAALRQAPDVIVVGEMRDAETMQIAVSAGETGHLVFSSVHTPDVSTTIARVADSFPPERQNTIRQELAMSLSAVLAQTLIPRLPAAGGGVIPGAELLIVGYGARQHVRKNALQHLHQEITITRKNGSFTFEECLADLVKRDFIDRKEAIARAVHPEEFERLL